MKLLFDHNLSHRLVRRLADVFPDSTQTRLLGFGRADDPVIWEHARANGFVIVTLDKDFARTPKLAARERKERKERRTHPEVGRLVRFFPAEIIP